MMDGKRDLMEDIIVHRSAWVAHGILGTIAFGLLIPLSFSIIILSSNVIIPTVTITNYWTNYIRIGIDIITFVTTLCAVGIAIVTMSGMGQAGEGHVKEVHHIVGLLLLLLVSVRTAVTNGLFQRLFPGNRNQPSLEEEVIADNPYDIGEQDVSAISNGSRQSTMNINLHSASLFAGQTSQRTPWHLILNIFGLFILFVLGVYQVMSGLGLFAKHYNTRDWGPVYLVYITSLVLGMLIAISCAKVYKEWKMQQQPKRSGSSRSRGSEFDSQMSGSSKGSKGQAFIGDVVINYDHGTRHTHREDRSPGSPMMQTAIVKANADQDFKQSVTRTMARDLAHTLIDNNDEEEDDEERRSSSMQTAFDKAKSDRGHLRSSTQMMTRNIAHALMFKSEGDDAYRNKEYEEAIEQYTQAIEIDGENCGYYSSRAAAYLKLGNNNANLMALQDSMTAIEIGPNSAKGHCQRGEALVALERYEDAVAAYKEGLEHCPNNLALQDGLADARRHQYKWRR